MRLAIGQVYAVRQSLRQTLLGLTAEYTQAEGDEIVALSNYLLPRAVAQ